MNEAVYNLLIVEFMASHNDARSSNKLFAETH